MGSLCEICQEPFQIFNVFRVSTRPKLSAMACGHVFHKFCLDTWLEQYRKNSCPKCRFVVNQRQGKKSIELFLEMAPFGTCKTLKRVIENNRHTRGKFASLKLELDALNAENVSLTRQIRVYSAKELEHKIRLLQLTQCQKRLTLLQTQIRGMRVMDSVANCSLQDAEEIVASGTLDKSQLARLYVACKKENERLKTQIKDAEDRNEMEKYLMTEKLKKMKTELDDLKNARKVKPPEEINHQLRVEARFSRIPTLKRL